MVETKMRFKATSFYVTLDDSKLIDLIEWNGKDITMLMHDLGHADEITTLAVESIAGDMADEAETRNAKY